MFAKNLKYLREKNGIEQLELALRLGKKSSSSISEWEKGKYTPKIGVLNDIAEFFGVTITDLMNTDLSKPKSITLTLINDTTAKLEEPRQKVVLATAQSQLQEQEQEKSNVISHDFSVKKIVNDYENDGTEDVDISGTVAAGFGSFNEDKSQPIKTVTMNENDVPHHYDLVFEVSGDSMYPTFEDREIIFVKKTTEVTNGMIGCVEINGYAFIKKMYIEDGRLRLVSLNNDYDENGNRIYPDFYADDNDEIFIIGKVVM